jgi:hypothetical protein
MREQGDGMQKLVNPAKALRTLRKTPLILSQLLQGVSQEQAASLRDGADGWSILYILCHMRDVEAIFTDRVRDLLSKPNPIFNVVPNEELMRDNSYAAQNAHAAFEEYYARRQRFISLVEPLTDEQWLLSGAHPDQGPATLLDVAINNGLHDIDHIEQIMRCLNK